jgi:hypothetical protein
MKLFENIRILIKRFFLVSVFYKNNAKLSKFARTYSKFRAIPGKTEGRTIA